MFDNSKRVSRRNVLKTAGSSLAALGTTGFAAADPDDIVEINVGFSAESGRKSALDAANHVVREIDAIDAVTIRTAKRAATALENRADVRYVEENGRVQALAQTLPWGVDRVDADVATANGHTGSGADVAIIDTGIDSDHPDLQANLGSGQAFVNCNSSHATCNRTWDDDHGHGTHVAGIVGGVDNSRGVVGVGPDVTLHAVKVLDHAGSGTYSDVASGITHVANYGWDVANLSLGGSSGSTMLHNAVQYADNNGVNVVAAAGNSGPCTNCVGYPASYPEAMAVSSTNSSNQLSSFSSTGPEVEIAAPGTDVYSTYAGGTYDTFSGTSMACPHVASAATILRAQGYTNSGARTRLKSTAQGLGLPSNQVGAGLLDVWAAV